MYVRRSVTFPAIAVKQRTGVEAQIQLCGI
jgi:hypothetical protein